MLYPTSVHPILLSHRPPLTSFLNTGPTRDEKSTLFQQRRDLFYSICKHLVLETSLLRKDSTVGFWLFLKCPQRLVGGACERIGERVGRLKNPRQILTYEIAQRGHISAYITLPPSTRERESQEKRASERASCQHLLAANEREAAAPS